MPAWHTSSQLPQRMHRSSSTDPVAGTATPARTPSAMCVSICGRRIFDSTKIGQTLLHSPQFTQWSARDSGLWRSAIATPAGAGATPGGMSSRIDIPRSEEHTSELQLHVNLVCRLLLEKKKKK